MSYFVDVTITVRMPVHGPTNWLEAVTIAKRYVASRFPGQVVSVGHSHIETVDGDSFLPSIADTSNDAPASGLGDALHTPPPNPALPDPASFSKDRVRGPFWEGTD